MKESEAWRILAEEHDAGRSHRSSAYLCDCLNSAEEHNLAIAAIPTLLRAAMIGRIRDAVGQPWHAGAYDRLGYDFNKSIEARRARVLACLMFSEQCRDEERAK